VAVEVSERRHLGLFGKTLLGVGIALAVGLVIAATVILVRGQRARTRTLEALREASVIVRDAIEKNASHSNVTSRTMYVDRSGAMFRWKKASARAT
jgi:hypothetical protein